MKPKYFQLAPDFEPLLGEEIEMKRLVIPMQTHVGDQSIDEWSDLVLAEYREHLQRTHLLENIIAAYSEGKKQIAMTMMRDTIQLPEVFWLALEHLVVDASGIAKDNAAMRHEESNREADLVRAAFKDAKERNPAIGNGTFCDDYRNNLIAKAKSIAKALEGEKDNLESLRERLEVANTTAAKAQIRAQIKEVKNNIKALKNASQKAYSKKTLGEWIAGL